VARAVAALRAAADERARRAELDRVRVEGEAREALARAAEQRRRRRLLLAAGGVIALVLLAGLGVSLWQMALANTAEWQANQNLEAEQHTQRQAFEALRSITENVVERRFAQGAVLTADDRAFLRGIIAQFDAFTAIQGDDAYSRALRAEGRFRVGNMRSRLGELKEAEQDYGQALSIYQQLAADFPALREYRRQLAAGHNNRGNLLHDMGRLREAEQDFDQAVSIFKQLAADCPAAPDYRQDLARGHNNRGTVLRDTGRLEEAEQDYGQALGIQKKLAADSPMLPDLRNELAVTCVNLALLHEQQGNWAAAKGLLLEGRPHHLAALKANPRHPEYRRFYRNHLSALTQLHAGLLERDDAVRTAETCRDLGWDAPVDAYDAACGLSLCLPIVAKHAKLDDQRRQEAARFYGDAAMQLLREAVGKGYENVAHMKQDTDLDPLRPREDFKKLIGGLEAKGK
jgi:tetratricopeptide (TPR) repeat protein